MSIAAATLALARELPFGDRVLQLRPLTYEDLARLSLWVEERARAAVFRADDVAQEPLLQAFLNSAAAGQYEPGGDTFQAATRSEAGRRKILELMLVPPDGEKDPRKWREDTSFDLLADDAAFVAALKLAAELNSNPKAVAARRRPTTP